MNTPLCSQGWTDAMYGLMDSDYSEIGAIFSISVMVVISFLGLQLFTSALCTSAAQARLVCLHRHSSYQ